MTARDYIDELKISLMRHRLSTSFSDPELLSYINRARRDVQRLTVGRFPERYSVILNIDLLEDPGFYPGRYYVPLPDDIIDIVHVALNYVSVTDDAPASSRARLTSHRELEMILSHSWNAPTILEPVYLTQRNQATGENALYLYIGDSTVDIATYATLPVVEVWAVVAIGSIEDYDLIGNNDTETVIPVMFEEMVILFALKMCVEKKKDMTALQNVMIDISDYTSLFDLQDYFKLEAETLLLPTKEAN